MFKLYTDKNNTFKCKVAIEGANEKTAVARLVIEGESHNLMFDGKIKEGVCEVPIGKFKNFDNFKSKGQVKLEVIADDTYFTPWKSEYILEQSRVVTVEMIEEETSSKPLVEVTEVSYIDDVPKVSSENHGEKIYKQLVQEGVNTTKYKSFDSLIKNDVKAKRVVKKYISENKITGKTLESTLGYLVDKF
jgi:predicted GNAT family acetyltransferase